MPSGWQAERPPLTSLLSSAQVSAVLYAQLPEIHRLFLVSLLGSPGLDGAQA